MTIPEEQRSELDRMDSYDPADVAQVEDVDYGEEAASDGDGE